MEPLTTDPATGSDHIGMRRVGDPPRPRVRCVICRKGDAFSGDLCATCRARLTYDFLATIDEALAREYRRMLERHEPDLTADQSLDGNRMHTRRRSE